MRAHRTDEERLRTAVSAANDRSVVNGAVERRHHRQRDAKERYVCRRAQREMLRANPKATGIARAIEMIARIEPAMSGIDPQRPDVENAARIGMRDGCHPRDAARRL